jgi:hypothetical protein
MTPEERNLIAELFDRLAALEDAPRDPEAERAIRDGLRQAPNAIYPLVQTALVQDEALKRADARIQELESQLGAGAPPPRQGSFLDNMRDSLWGHRDGSAPRAGSVPSVRPGDAPRMGAPPVGGPGGYTGGQGQQMGAGTPGGAGGTGGSFLGTAAAAAAGMIGGSLLLDGIRSMMGHQHGFGGFGNTPTSAAGLGSGGSGGSPWGGAGSASGGNLSRDAGLDDIGRSGRDDGSAGRSQGLFGGNDTAEDDAQNAEQDDDQFDADDGDDDFGDDGGSDGGEQ